MANRIWAARTNKPMPVRPARAGLRWLTRSLASRLALVAVVFLAVPVLIYQQLRDADRQKQALLVEAAVQQGQLVARALTPTLQRATAASLPRLSEDLQQFAGVTNGLKLLLRPAAMPGAKGFYYVAAYPAATNAYLDLERERLLDQGVLAHLAQSCSGNMPLAIRVPTPAGGLELLTSITPVTSPLGCWAVVTSNTAPYYLGTSLGQAYWQTPEMKVAALIYLAMAALIMALFLGVWSNLRRFGLLARRISDHEAEGASFAEQNTVPELRGVAEDFDRLVDTLRSAANKLRRAAEDNAHAFKTPIAVIRQSLEPLNRSGVADTPRARRALDMIERSLDRLDGLVSFARRMDEAAADLLEPPRRRIDLSILIEQMLHGYGAVMAERQLRLSMTMKGGLVVRAGKELLETVIDNIIENAMSFSPAGGVITVRLARIDDNAVLTVQDQGPGVDPANLERIFERYFSQREPVAVPPAAAAQDAMGRAAGGTIEAAEAPAALAEPHFGIGLWITRRNVEAIGGTVVAANHAKGGLEMRVVLPLAH